MGVRGEDELLGEHCTARVDLEAARDAPEGIALDGLPARIAL